MKKGMSLIVLVITILVMIILAGVVVVGLSNNNPIESAQTAKVLTELSSAQSQLSLYASNKVKDTALSSDSVTNPKLGTAAGSGAYALAELTGAEVEVFLVTKAADGTVAKGAAKGKYYKLNTAADALKQMGITNTTAKGAEYYSDENGNLVLVFDTVANAKPYAGNVSVCVK